MTSAQALREARKRWGKHAAVECRKAGGFIGDDFAWHESLCAVNQDGKIASNKPRRFYIKSRNPLVLGQIKYWVASYVVGQINTVVIPFFSVRGVGESWEKAFEAADR